jgi:zinc protease
MNRHSLPSRRAFPGPVAITLLTACASLAVLPASAPAASEYAVAISKTTHADPAWAGVAAALEKKHGPGVAIVEWDGQVVSCQAPLAAAAPRYVAFVAKPQEIDRQFVADVHRLSRRMDSDPFGDFLWGIVTGYEAADALRIAEAKSPLLIHRSLNTTGVDSGMFDTMLTLSDGAKGKVHEKSGGAPVVDSVKPEDATGLAPMFADFWSQKQPQLLVTSSHATQYNLEMPFSQGLICSYANRFHVLRRDQLSGFGKFLRGVMFEADPKEVEKYIADAKAPELAVSKEPKVWIGAGNCLLGEIDRSRDTMAVTALSSGGVNQLVGYTVTTWYGRGGWGTLGMWQASRGSLSLAEAFYLNNQVIIEETQRRWPKLLSVEFNEPDIQQAMQPNSKFTRALQKTGYQNFEKDMIGLTHDRDVVAFYGDPKWEARLDPTIGAPQITRDWKVENSELVLRLKNTRDKEWKGAIESLLPKRMASAKLHGADGIESVLNDEFLLLRNLTLKPGEEKIIRVSKA